jgi:hypothetical protein
MMRSYTVGLAVVFGAVAVSYTRRACAELPSCSELVIQADPSVGTRWPGLLDVVRTTFGARDDVDRCAHVLLTSRDASILVQVSLPDGRSAARAIARREDVVPVLEALLVVPEPRAADGPPPLPPESMPPSADPVVAPLNALSAPRSDVRSDRASAAPERATFAGPQGKHVRIDLSAIAGARIGDGQTSVGLGALSFLDLYGWLVGFEGRADRYQSLASRLAGGALELALLGGRRFWVRDIAVDVVAGPAAALRGTSTVEAQSPAGTTTSSEQSRPVPRALFGARASFNARSTLHTFVGLDGEVGPSRVGAADRDPPRAQELPTWTFGVALGATVGTP